LTLLDTDFISIFSLDKILKKEFQITISGNYGAEMELRLLTGTLVGTIMYAIIYQYLQKNFQV